MKLLLKYKIFLLLFILLINFGVNAQEKGLVVSRVGEQEMFVNSKIIVFFSTLNNTKDVTYTCENLPVFGVVQSLNKGDGRIVFEPSVSDAGEYEITLNADSELGTSSQKFKLVVNSVDDDVNAIYVDPVNGSDTNSGGYSAPIKSLKKLIEGGNSLSKGTIIYLRSGNHGALIFSNSNLEMVYIVAEKGHTPMAERLSFPYATNWNISGMKISPEAANTSKKGVYVNLSGGARYIVVKNCEIYGTSDILDWPTNKHWYDYAGDGITSQGKYCTFKNNYIYNTDFPVTFQGKYNTLAYNVINNFSGDAVRGLADYGKFLYNQIKNAVVFDYYTGNHDDAFQSWLNGTPVKGIILRGNQITDISYPDLPLQTEIMQGVVDFDGFVEDWIIEDNLIVIHHNHGIALYGARNCKIVNNTVIKNPFKKYQPGIAPWIRINRTKTSEYSYGNLTRNNIMGSSFQDDYPGTFDHNFNTFGNTVIFVDYDKWNFHLKGNNIAVDRGELDEASSIDADGVLRNIGSPDLGCFERGAKDFDLNKPIIPDEIKVDELGATHVKLSWVKATDDFDIKEYEVTYKDKKLIVTNPVCLITDLYSKTKYRIKIVAVDYANNKSEFVEIPIETHGFDDDNYTALCSSFKGDQEITNKNKKEWIYGKNIVVGGVNDDRDLSGIFVFQIPSLPPNKIIKEASLSVMYQGINGTPSGNIDVYGLNYKRKATIENGLFYQGDYNNDSNGFAIMNDFITPSTSVGLVKTDSFASSRLLDYLKLQIENGAHGSNFLFIRFNVDVSNELNSSNYSFASGDNRNSFSRPILKFTLEHRSATDELFNKDIQLFPNPVRDNLFVKGLNNASRIVIINNSGKVISKINKDIFKEQMNISLIDLKTGVYYLKAIVDEKVIIRKFTKI